MNIRKKLFFCVLLFVIFSLWDLSGSHVVFRKGVSCRVHTAWAGSSSLVRRKEPAAENKRIVAPSFIRKGINVLVSYQRDIRNRMAALAKDSVSGEEPGALLLLLLLSFLYGVVHAAGPGHGKIALSSFVMSPEVGLAKGMILGVVIAVFHGFSALILVMLSLFGIHKFNLHSMNSIDTLQSVSASLLIILGIFMIIRLLNRSRAEKADTSAAVQRGNTSSSPHRLFALAVGLVPCSGIVILVLFIQAAGLWSIGIPLVLSTMAGMALTLSATGALMVLLKRGILFPFLSRGFRKLPGSGAYAVQLISPVLLILSGILLV